uniref:Cystatin domain-containing protein n=1 Tax=Xiphophorus couchianus TaxID=32473 RepID=A0A3B5LQT5_9TELE
MIGKWTEIKPATEETQKICDMLKSDTEKKWTKQSYEIFKAIEYRVQPVAGTNFLIKVIAHRNCLHMAVPITQNNLHVTIITGTESWRMIYL